MSKKIRYRTFINKDTHEFCIPIPDSLAKKLSLLESRLHAERNYEMIYRLVDHFWNCESYWGKRE